ncbi:hypothetical protein DFH09DRAFT_1344995 [Mycena vulgaris]|nr:hypothetical protein DFH09DRAFT_1344995 [Mycena vulgaris]
MLSGMTQKLKSTYAQITLNRVTVAFFLFSFIHCFAQGIIQSFLFSTDSQFAGLVTEIVHAADIPLKNITYLEGSSNRYVLRMCDDIPHGQAQSRCMVVFQSGVGVSSGSEAVESDTFNSLSILQDLTHGFSLSKDLDLGGNPIVRLESSAADPVSLSQQCARILVYPQQVLQNSVREDMTFIFLQFWLFGVSVYAVSQSSVPHILTALGTRFLILSWSAYIVIFRTNDQRTFFHQLVSAPGTPCGVELFPTYFAMRQAYNIADLVLSSTALVLSALLSWNLLKVYNAQSFKRVGAPAHVTRIYKFFMAVQACLQLEVFVLVAATSLWVDVLLTTAIREISAHTAVYDALIIGTAVCVIPWIVLMVSFLGLSFFFIAGWSIMFYSIVYRWTFTQWPYIGCFTVASFILIIASAILGAICWRNFDKGLAQYLHAEAALASLNFAPDSFQHSDVEKSGDHFYAYDEPEYPMATFQSAPAAPEFGQRRLRGPPPVYEKPYIAPF